MIIATLLVVLLVVLIVAIARRSKKTKLETEAMEKKNEEATR